jgi:integrase
MASLYKRPRRPRMNESGEQFSWQIKWRYNGKAWSWTELHEAGYKRARGVLDAKRDKMTRDELARFLTGDDGTPAGKVRVHTLGEAVRAWITRPGERGDETTRTYEVTERALGDLARVPLVSLTEQHLAQWFHVRKRASATQRGALIVLRGALTKAGYGHLIEPFAFDGKRLVEVVILTEAQIGTVLNAARQHGIWLPVAFTAELGVRWGEMAGLMARDVDLATGDVQVRRSLAQRTKRGDGFHPGPTKSRTQRTVRMGNSLTSHMRLVEGLPDDAAVFTPPQGDCWLYSHFRKAWKRTVADSPGVPDRTRFHDLRHSAAKRMLALPEVSIVDVSKALGHSSTAITGDMYGHFDDRSREALARGGLTL